MIDELKPCPFCSRTVALSVLEDDDSTVISAWVACSCGVEIHELRTEAEATARWNARPSAGSVEVTDEMVTAAMRAFEPMSSVLRYREKDKWHSCDIMAMRDALKAAVTTCLSNGTP